MSLTRLSQQPELVKINALKKLISKNGFGISEEVRSFLLGGQVTGGKSQNDTFTKTFAFRYLSQHMMPQW